eukprot:m.832982 g.832982  ORF g.832982 m.832982 type:complete len:747 (+) comp59465_c0_seq27:90-2330(+)
MLCAVVLLAGQLLTQSLHVPLPPFLHSMALQFALLLSAIYPLDPPLPPAAAAQTVSPLGCQFRASSANLTFSWSAPTATPKNTIQLLAYHNEGDPEPELLHEYRSAEPGGVVPRPSRVPFRLVLRVTVNDSPQETECLQMSTRSSSSSSSAGAAVAYIAAFATLAGVILLVILAVIWRRSHLKRQGATSPSRVHKGRGFIVTEMQCVSRSLHFTMHTALYQHLRSQQDSHKCLVKKLLDTAPRSSHAWNLFQSEIQKTLVISSIRSTQLLRAFTSGPCFSEDVLVFESAEIGTLFHYLTDAAAVVSPTSSISMMQGLTSGLVALHSHGIVHNSLNSLNCFVTTNGRVKIGNFSLSNIPSSEPQSLVPQAAEFSFQLDQLDDFSFCWLAPEILARTEIHGSVASDKYSLGVLFWHILAHGRSPYFGVPRDELLAYSQINRLPQPGECPIELYYLMLQLWLTEPTERKSLIKLRTELSEIRKNDQVLELQPQQTPSKRQLSVDECTASPTVLSFARRIESSVCLYAGSDELPASITSSPFLRSPSKTPISLPLKDPSPGADTAIEQELRDFEAQQHLNEQTPKTARRSLNFADAASRFSSRAASGLRVGTSSDSLTEARQYARSPLQQLVIDRLKEEGDYVDVLRQDADSTQAPSHSEEVSFTPLYKRAVMESPSASPRAQSRQREPPNADQSPLSAITPAQQMRLVRFPRPFTPNAHDYISLSAFFFVLGLPLCFRLSSPSQTCSFL